MLTHTNEFTQKDQNVITLSRKYLFDTNWRDKSIENIQVDKIITVQLRNNQDWRK